MEDLKKRSIPAVLETLTYLPDRTPEASMDGGTAGAFATLFDYRDGGVYVGHYSGSSAWERHPQGDEIVMAIEGYTTLILLEDGVEVPIDLKAQEMVVVRANTWHRFKNARELKVMAVTPQPSEHQLEHPGG